jgi:hypothetical protein
MTHLSSDRLRSFPVAAAAPKAPIVPSCETSDIVKGMNGVSDLACHFKTHGQGGKQSLSIYSKRFSNCKSGGKHRWRGVKKEPINTIRGGGELCIIEVLSMTTDPIGQGSTGAGTLSFEPMTVDSGFPPMVSKYFRAMTLTGSVEPASMTGFHRVKSAWQGLLLLKADHGNLY